MSANWTIKMRMMALLHFMEYGKSKKRECTKLIMPIFAIEFIKSGGDPKSAYSSFGFKLDNFAALYDPTKNKMNGFSNDDAIIFEKYRANKNELKEELKLSLIKNSEILDNFINKKYSFNNVLDLITGNIKNKSKNKYMRTDYELLEEIGRMGEKFFDDNKDKSTFSDVMEVLSHSKPEDFMWKNKEFEMWDPYDFESSKYLIDVKTTITSDKGFYLSAAEKELIDTDKLYILKIWMTKEYMYLKHKLYSSSECKNLFKFKASKYKLIKK